MLKPLLIVFAMLVGCSCAHAAVVSNDFAISGASQVSGTVAAPTIAAGNTGFIVAWVDYSGGVDFPIVAASLLSKSGIASAPFGISDQLGRPRPFRNQRIQAAFDGTNWLVVWSDDRAPGNGIRGALVSTIGAVLGGSDFLIATTTGLIEEDPLVCFNGADFVVAWQDAPNANVSGSNIFYTRVTSAGIVAAKQNLTFLGTTPNQILNFLSAQTPSGDTLLLYRDGNDKPVQTRATRIAQDGSLRDPGGTGIFHRDAVDGGYGLPVGVYYDGTKWNILSSFDQSTDSSIFLHTYSADGSTLTHVPGSFAEMGGAPLNTGDVLAPAFGGPSGWLFLRNNKVTDAVDHIIGKRVTLAGQDLDPAPFVLDTATNGIRRNAVAAQIGTTAAVVWLDGRGSSTQPGDGVGIAAAMVDFSAAAGTDTPLIAKISATPTSGEKPLTVSFSAALSTGAYDSLQWLFGDGTASTDATPTHTYKNNGTYIAQLSLIKGVYIVSDTVLIAVGTGLDSDKPVQTGQPVGNSNGLTSALFLQSLGVTLDFRTTASDSLRITGVLDNGELTTDLSGFRVVVTVGSFTQSFTLDSNGAYKSDPSKKPQIVFSVTPATGAFGFTATNADLVAAFDALGATNANFNKDDKKIVNVPVTITLGDVTATATAGMSYLSVKNNTATGSYIFQSTGDEISGSYFVKKFTASEGIRKADGVKFHNYSINGQLILPNAKPIVPAAGGNWVISLGNYTETHPTTEFSANKGSVKFLGKSIKTGMSSFTINSKGQFSIKFKQVLADSASGGTGLALANSGTNVTKVDLNLSLQLDLDAGEHIDAGRFIFIERDTAAAKKWVLRAPQTTK